MSTAEATIMMVNRLTEPELLNVQDYIKKIFASRKREVVNLKKYKETDFVKLIDKSIEQAKNGDVYSWADVQKAAYAKHGL